MVIATSTKFKVNNEDIASVYASIDLVIRNNKLSDDGKQYYYVTDLYAWGDISPLTFPSAILPIPSYVTTGSFKQVHTTTNYTYMLDGFGRVLRADKYANAPNYEISNSQKLEKIVGGLGHLVAISNTGAVYTTGSNDFGQLGSGNTTNTIDSWFTIPGDWYDIAAGESHTVALKSDGSMWAWGRNDVGQLGDNSIINRSSPVQVSSISTNWDTVYAGGAVSFAVNSLEELWSWGSGTSYSRGDGSLVNRSNPAQVGSDVDWGGAKIGLSYAVKSDGTLWTWGLNDLGQLGHGDTTTRSVPTQVGSETTWYNAYYNTLDDDFIAALKNDGTLWISGTGTFSPIYSVGSQANTFVQVVNIKPSEESPNFVDISYSNTNKFGFGLRQTWAASGYTSNAWSTSSDVLYTSSATIIIPDGVTAISAVAVGGGGGGKIQGSPIHPVSTRRGGNAGAGASLVWSEGIPVVGGDTITVVVGAAGEGEKWTFTGGGGSTFIPAPTTTVPSTSSTFSVGTGSIGGASYIAKSGSNVMVAGGGDNVNMPIWSVNPSLIGHTYAGYSGGIAYLSGNGAARALGGGGAGGWTSNGGAGSSLANNLGADSPGGGGGGGGTSIASFYSPSTTQSNCAPGGMGGGVGLYGPGPNGAGGILNNVFPLNTLQWANASGTSGSYGPSPTSPSYIFYDVPLHKPGFGGGGGGGTGVSRLYTSFSPQRIYWHVSSGLNGGSGAVRLVFGAYDLKVT